ncbi:phage tail tip lysozyme [Rhizobium leguminosarum]|uniref:phage tail tip lysozyme n=1 Tax=Rhizobium leguminosarum TaxID=384 RepID=UPI00042A1712|nr:phage tail tip lysozyme [Rhizobium leguminosarum]
MATVVDSLIITLGLDPAQFNKGQKEAASAFVKTQQQAEKSGKQIEDSAKKTANAISSVTREVLSLYAVFLGARGIKEFVQDLTLADAALGRFARNLNESPQTIAAWGNAAERMGGSAEATAGSFERIGKALYDLHRNGQMLPKEFSQLQALTGRRIDTEHGVDRFLKDTAGALKAMSAIDPAQAHFLAQGMGIDDATANVMIKYGDAIGAYIDQIKKLSPTGDAIKAAQDLQDKWATLQQTAVALANTILGTLGPELSKLLTQMTDWVTKNSDWLQSGIVEAVKNFADYLKSIDWAAVGDGLRTFGEDAHKVADAIGGITTATEALFLLWAGSKALGVIASMRTAVGGGAAAGGAASGGGLMALFGKIFAVAGAAYMLTDASPGPSQEKIKQADKNAWYNRPSSNQPDYGALTRDPSLHGEALAGNSIVDGRPVSKGNPLPVVISDNGSSGGGFWGKVGNAISSFFGGGSSSGSENNSSSSPLKASGPSAGVRGWWTKDRQQHAYERLTKEAGLSDAGAKGLISRWMNVEASGGPGSVNSIGATGIAQMLGSRKQRLMQMSAQSGTPWKDYDLQLSHIIEELKGSERKAGDRLRNAKTASDGAIGASMYERAEGYNSLTGRDNFTGRTLGGMRGIGDYVGSVLSGSALSSIQNDHRVTTSSSSNEMNVGTINVNAPNATDSKGIASSITDSLFRQTLAATANYGPR